MIIPIVIKDIWRYRKRYAGVFLEQMVVFILLVLTSISLIASLKQYNAPGLLDTDDLIGFTYYNNEHNIVSHARTMMTIGEEIAGLSYVTESSLSVNLLPYLRGDNFLYTDSIDVDGISAEVFLKWTDTDAYDVLGLKLSQGQWITSSKMSDGSIPVIITQDLAETWNMSAPLGLQLHYSGRVLTIIGVLDGLRHDVFGESKNAMIMPLSYANITGNGIEAVARIKKADKDIFYSDCYQIFSRHGLLDSGRLVVFDMNSLKNTNMSGKTISLSLMMLVMIFLMIFSLVALYGTITLTMKVRIKEYAIKMSLGASKYRIAKDALSEIVCMTFSACLPGIVLAFLQSETLSTTMTGVCISVFIMISASVSSTLYPAFKIANMSVSNILKGE